MPRGVFHHKKGPKFSTDQRTARDMARFWAQVDTTAQRGCWPWKGSALTWNGYGSFLATIHGKRYWRAHRIAWAILRGDVPRGQYVLHSCDNRLCCNPEHLFLGDAKSNADDCKSKGRNWFGERNGRSKLTEDDVRAIRASNEKTGVLARRYGVHWTTLSKARDGTFWPHVQ